MSRSEGSLGRGTEMSRRSLNQCRLSSRFSVSSVGQLLAGSDKLRNGRDPSTPRREGLHTRHSRSRCPLQSGHRAQPRKRRKPTHFCRPAPVAVIGAFRLARQRPANCRLLLSPRKQPPAASFLRGDVPSRARPKQPSTRRATSILSTLPTLSVTHHRSKEDQDQCLRTLIIAGECAPLVRLSAR